MSGPVRIVGVALVLWLGLSACTAAVWVATARAHRRPEGWAGARLGGRSRRTRAVIKVVGALTAADALAVRAAADESSREPAVIDLSSISAFDGTGLAILMTPGAAPPPRLVGLHDAVERLLGLGDEGELCAELRREGRILVLTPCRAASPAARRLTALLDEGLAYGASGLRIDLARLTLLEPRDALAVADAAQWWASRTGTPVVVTGIAAALREPLRLAGLPTAVACG